MSLPVVEPLDEKLLRQLSGQEAWLESTRRLAASLRAAFDEIKQKCLEGLFNSHFAM